MQYGLIGEHLGHSFSKEIHENIADYTYELLELKPEEVGDYISGKSFKGINVTIPYKQTVMPYLDEISEQAKAIGAVNTIVNRDGKLYGYNTDFLGMVELINHAAISVEGKKVLILGTGGTSKTAHAVADSLGASEVIHVSRKSSEIAVSYEEAVRIHSDAGIIINTTPVGMYPNVDACPIDIENFKNLSGVVDAIYNPLSSNLVIDARKKGIKAEGGLYMLCAQAVYASAHFLDKEVDTSLIEKVFKILRDQKRNIVLIGMPTCGKSTLGRILKKQLKMKLFDIDKLIVDRIGESISDFMGKNGEPAFRKIESEIIKEISLEDGAVIATGGGAVLNYENVKALKKNGVVVFIDRALENLIVAQDRPLSSDKERLAKMFTERAPIYRGAADIVIDANTSLEDVVSRVIKELKK